MLTELSIKDFAIIDQISVTFNEGLTVLTGETGAGKSIIIDAVQLLVGGRGSVEYVRHGTKKAEIEGLFTIDYKNHAAYQVGKQFGIEIQDEMLVLQRVITETGRSICRVNGKLVTLAILREFGKTLVDIHSQHETQSLMNPETHIQLLDFYDYEAIQIAKAEYTQIYDQLIKLEQRYKELSENEQQLTHRLDLLIFQKKELEQANLQPDEDDILEKERHQLVNFENIFLGVERAYNALYGDEKGLEWLNIARLALEENKAHDPFINEKLESLSNYYYLLEEMSFDLRDFKETLHYDSHRLNEIELRLDEISRLKKKYGPTVNEIITYLAEIEEEIERITNKDSHIEALSKQIDGLVQDAFLEAKQLHDIRKKAADNLTSDVHRELKGLYLENASFTPRFTNKIPDDFLKQARSYRSLLNKNGFDTVYFFISTNPGEPLKELNKVASGGELSRIMLAMKSIFAKHQGVTSVIFDEVDTGVSGRVAQAMAEKIFQISLDSQVLVITHLPQVAAMSDTHKLISKAEKNERTSTYVTELTKSDKINEVSRMMTGAKLTETAKEHGKKLLQLANLYKQKYN